VRLLLALLLLLVSCAKTPEAPVAPAEPRPSILLVTLDTTRADAIGPSTPSINALAARGRSYTYAYATVPQTLPSHASMMTGLYPGGHGVHENARTLDGRHSVLAEQLKSGGYRTAAFISAFPLAKRYGLARGFDVYDEDFGGDRAERDAQETTDRALAFLGQAASQPLFLWVHYYDPHYPYTRGGYQGEVAFMDAQLGRLVAAFERQTKGPHAIAVVSDHGEGLGEHGEQQHGNLLYQTTMHVPLVLVGPGVGAGAVDTPVSTRRIFHTILDWAGIDATQSLRGDFREPVIAGEAMKPFLDYGWQPQVMAVEGTRKAILAGRIEVYDVATDPRESRTLASADLSRALRATLRDYPLPSPKAAAVATNLSEEEQRKLASLGYVSSTAKPVVRKDAPVPADMAPLFPLLDRVSGLFVAEEYAAVIPLLEQLQAKDPNNLDTALRLAAAHSALGHDDAALASFRRAEAIAPDSADVRTYLALHYAKTREWERAVPMLERIVAEDPQRLPPLEALAALRERQKRIEDAVALRQKIYARRTATPAELEQLGAMAMSIGSTAAAIGAFEQTRGHDLELGVLYLSARRLDEARAALDRVPPSHPGYPMALFKRAQVSVLLREPDAPSRIARAREHADATTRTLIESERLFR
jgi:choline-sulfatase